jgi:hypothetical protein
MVQDRAHDLTNNSFIIDYQYALLKYALIIHDDGTKIHHGRDSWLSIVYKRRVRTRHFVTASLGRGGVAMGV